MKFKIRFTNHKGEIEELWLQIGQRLPIVNTFLGEKTQVGTFEVMAVEGRPENSQNGGASRQER